MEIKRKEDKPMVIHTKEKPKLHVKSAPETKIKGQNVLTVQRGPKIAGECENAAPVKKRDMRTIKNVRTQRGRTGKQAANDRQTVKSRQAAGGRQSDSKHVNKRTAEISLSAKEKLLFAQYGKKQKDKEKGRENRRDTLGTITAVGSKAALEQMEGGNEVYDAYMVVDSLLRPATSATDAGRNLFRRQQEAKAAQKRIKKVNSAKKIGKKAAQKAAQDTAKKTAKETEKIVVKETAKAGTKAAVSTAAAAAGSVATGPGGVLIGAAAGEAAGIAMDVKDVRNSSRNRMIQFFTAKLRQEDNQDSIAKTLKDLAMMRLSLVMKYVVKYAALFLTGVFLLVALVALPVTAVLAVIYNSPLAIFFPSISSSGETAQQVLSAYVSEFNANVDAELLDLSGCDRGEKVYVNFTGEGIPDNYCDILAVYMVKYGNGDTATDMTDKAKQNLKSVFDDMCSYSVTTGTETETDDEGNTANYTVKYVNVTLKTYLDMVPVYGFDAGEQEMLNELMKPENLALMGYEGGGGGQTISPEQYQAIVDSISDANGKKVVEFALSKVGYPYSQALRDSGTHFDCSSLAYYAWLGAGVSIQYQGSTTAGSEAQYCYDNNWLVHYDEMQPGDLIFYSYEKNGRFMNISHVAIYVGDGMVVEAANARLGVVYRPVQGRSSIVMIGRPR